MSRERDGVIAGDEDQGQDDPTPPSGTTNADSEALMSAAAARRKPADGKPNVRLGQKQRPITVDGPINIGMATVDMPDEEAQRAGWYVDPKLAALLLAQYPGVYKTVTTGESRQAPEEAPEEEVNDAE